ncbi:uncharacterized protein LOC113284292 [Papaver somniferum]|uniref:uncharacterized protein LOC113284292 n=1 Tax=Papaver somniferum TaxID=3469 RepID=UPI000E6FC387|nr:uncharacterized protein LOC113284292 [Papaver somniferum]
MNLVAPDKSEFVGCCNGFACITKVYNEDFAVVRGMIVVNPTRREILSLPYLHPCTEMGCKYLCHGFGFDLLTQEYKVVIVFTSRANDEFISVVLTLGTKTWRKIVTSVADISPPPGSSYFPKRMVTRASGNIRTPATLCGGDLFWRMVVENEEVNNYNNNNNKSHMLLSFDIHNEKIRFIRLPAECNLTQTPTTTLVVEHHLLEHKGYLCIAQSEKATRNNIDQSRQDSFVCRCSFTVQLYILKDKVKQVWAKGETFGVQVQQLGLAPAPFCCYFDAATATPTTLPTRIMSFSDQVLLYWFDRKCLKFYNLQTERLEVVRSSCSSNWIGRFNFEAKMKRFPPERGVGGDDKSYCPYMEYQLHTQVENIRSLKTFIPAGEIIKFDGTEEFQRFFESNKNTLPTGWVITARESIQHHAFY